MTRPTLAVFKFASCDGCQLSLLNCEAELLALADRVQVANFIEASREVVRGPYDLVLVEGAITTSHDAERIHQVRRAAKYLVTIGACATAGGIQALRNFARVSDYLAAVYPSPEHISALDTSTPISEHVQVDCQLYGCPVNRAQLLEVITARLAGRRPVLPAHSVCLECKQRGTPCLAVARGVPCLGPVTRAGCEALCPAHGRGCYGCFGPAESPNVDALAASWRALGVDDRLLRDALRSFNAWAPPFRGLGFDHDHSAT